MKTQVFSAPEEIKVPCISKYLVNGKFDHEGYNKAEAEYLAELKAMLLRRSDTKNVGEIIQIPYADSYAQYMVAGMKPLQLVHIPLGDAWDTSLVNGMTAEDVQARIDARKK